VKSYRKELWFETPGRRAFLNITPQVEAALKESGVREGLALVNAMHITASVFINDDEKGLHADYDAWLERLAPHEPVSGYRHNRTGEDNADAHMKRQIMGREVVVAITAGKLDFGPWEQIFYGEFDGGRRKRVLIKIVGDERRTEPARFAPFARPFSGAPSCNNRVTSVGMSRHASNSESAFPHEADVDHRGAHRRLACARRAVSTGPILSRSPR